MSTTIVRNRLEKAASRRGELLVSIVSECRTGAKGMALLYNPWLEHLCPKEQLGSIQS